MGAAALPRSAGQVRGDGLDQSGVGIRGHQTHAGQAASHQVGEELVPRRPCLGGGHAHAQDLTVAVVVDAGGEQDDCVDHASALADLHRERISGDEGERTGLVEGPVAEVLDDHVELFGHP